MPGKRDCTNYQTLADFGRLVGVNRTTVLAWVRAGKIKSSKKDNSKKRHRLNEKLFYSNATMELFSKPYPKYSTTWSEADCCVLQNWAGTDEQLAKAVGRSVNAVRIKRSRLNAEQKINEKSPKITCKLRKI